MRSGSIFIIPPIDYENNKKTIIFMDKCQDMIDNATIQSKDITKGKKEPIDIFELYSLRELWEEIGDHFTSCHIENRPNFLQAMIDADSNLDNFD